VQRAVFLDVTVYHGIVEECFDSVADPLSIKTNKPTPSLRYAQLSVGLNVVLRSFLVRSGTCGTCSNLDGLLDTMWPQ
jgi:hypothetical protein